MSTNYTKQNRHPNGFVSIVVAALLMVILALITIGFTRIMQREQRQAIDRQLSRQALYAAESGINDVLGILTLPAVSRPAAYQASSKDTCDTAGLGPYNNGNLSGPTDNTISYTCAMYDQSPGSLDYDPITTEESKVVELKSASTNDFVSLQVSWGHPTSNDLPSLDPCGSGASYELPDVRSNVVPVLKFDLTRKVGASYDRNSLLQNTDYIYLVPCDGVAPGAHAFELTQRGSFVQVPCSGAGAQPCVVNITGLDAGTPSDTFFARIRPVYADARVSLAATDTAGPVQFLGAQTGVDVTAKSGDVVRRLRVNVPINATGSVPEAALQAFDGICKLLDVNNETPGSVDIVDNCFGGPPPPPPDPPPYFPVPAGDGYSPISVSGRIYNMFHHRQGIVIVCHQTDLSYCAGREWFGNTQYLAPQHSNMVELNGDLYYSAQGYPAGGYSGPPNTFGIGCFNPALNRDCGFTPLGTTNHVSSTIASPPATDFSAGIDNITRVNGRLYTAAIDNAGNHQIYCADPATSAPCAGFVPYNIGIVTAPNTFRVLEVGFNVVGSQILFSIAAVPATSMHLGCFDTATQTRCAGWGSNTVVSPYYNTTAIRVGSSYCVYQARRPGIPTFDVHCVSIANGNVVGTPANFLAQPKPARAVQIGSNWFNWDPYYDGSKIYIGATAGVVYDTGSLYCYDRAIANVCAGWGGDNGWQDGSPGNDFSGIEIYTVTRVGSSCLFGIGDNSGFTPDGGLTFGMTKLSPINAGTCP